MKEFLMIVFYIVEFFGFLAIIGLIACVVLSIKEKYCPRFPWGKM